MIWDIPVKITSEDLDIDIMITASVSVELHDNGWRYANTIGSLEIDWEWPQDMPIKSRTALVRALKPIMQPIIERKMAKAVIRRKAR